ncbi:hypothetical protein CsatB_023702 [Cannabis sativa]
MGALCTSRRKIGGRIGPLQQPADIGASWLNISKHSFILWLSMLNRIKTKDRLQYMDLENSKCLLCNIEDEIVPHLFFECSFSLECLEKVKSWLNWGMAATTLERIIRWLRRAKISKVKKSILVDVIAALVYEIWLTRNNIFW